MQLDGEPDYPAYLTGPPTFPYPPPHPLGFLSLSRLAAQPPYTPAMTLPYLPFPTPAQTSAIDNELSRLQGTTSHDDDTSRALKRPQEDLGSSRCHPPTGGDSPRSEVSGSNSERADRPHVEAEEKTVEKKGISYTIDKLLEKDGDKEPQKREALKRLGSDDEGMIGIQDSINIHKFVMTICYALTRQLQWILH